MMFLSISRMAKNLAGIPANEIVAILLCLISGFLSQPSHAGGCSPLQIGLWPGAQLVPKEQTVCGLRLDLPLGDNDNVWGIDIGVGGRAKTLKGIQIGFFGVLDGSEESQSLGIQIAWATMINKGSFAGVQAGYLGNRNEGVSFSGLQIAGLVNTNNGANYKGVQLAGLGNVGKDVYGIQLGGILVNGLEKLYGIQIGGMLNRAERIMNGVQIGVIHNRAEIIMNGVQIGVTNYSEQARGLQMGVVNVCKYLKGVQIGIVNVVTSRYPDSIYFSPIMNVGF